MDTFAEGVELRVWRESDFEAFQKQSEEIDLCEQVANSLRDETVAVLHFFEHSPAEALAIPTLSTDPPPPFWQRLKEPRYVLTLVAPKGWVHQNMVTYARFARDRNELVGEQTIDPEEVERTHYELTKLSFSPYTYLALIASPNYYRAWQTAAWHQTRVNLARIVCALERCRASQGHYPQELQELVPQFIAKIPVDLIGGKPLIYRRTSDQEFKLYSVGWNQTDDGGIVVSDGKTPNRPDLDKGDWTLGIDD